MSGTVIRVVTGLIVQRQTIRVPAGVAVSAPVCHENPTDCCTSGGGGGCCFPPPPTPLWAWRYEAGGSCECAPACVRLDYDPARDAWYSADLSPFCGLSAAYLRLKCVSDAYAFDLVDGADVVLVAGVIQSSPAQSCEPFLLAAFFTDTLPYLCDGTYGYVISEVDCTPGSGSGSGGGDEVTDCCPGVLLPATLHAAFGGALAGLGTVPLTLSAHVWQGTSDACGNAAAPQINLACFGGSFQISCPGVPGTGTSFSAAGAAESCAPFVLRLSGTASGACAGAWTVTVTA